MYRTRNAACLEGHRGFESHPLRHRPRAPGSQPPQPLQRPVNADLFALIPWLDPAQTPPRRGSPGLLAPASPHAGEHTQFHLFSLFAGDFRLSEPPDSRPVAGFPRDFRGLRYLGSRCDALGTGNNRPCLAQVTGPYQGRNRRLTGAAQARVSNPNAWRWSSQQNGMGRRMICLSFSPEGWAPSRIACWMSGARNARRSTRRR